MKFSLFLTASLLLPLPLLCAQNTDDSKVKQVRFIEFNCNLSDLYMTQADLPAPAAPGSDSDSPPAPPFNETQIQCSPGFRSEYYPYDPSKPIKLIRHVGKQITLVDSIDLTNACKLPLILITPASNPDQFSFSVIADDREHFPGGAFNVFNFSSNRVTISVGSINRTLQPNQGDVIIPENVDHGSEVTVYLPARDQTVYASNWMIRKQIRYIFFVTDDPTKPGSVMFFKTSDSVEYLTEK